jgi:hypothetical protein
MTPILAVLSMLGALVTPAPEPVPIVQGVDATTCQWPSVVALRTASGAQFCTGALVHERIVITAGHCVEPTTGLMPASVAFGEDAESPTGAASVQTCVWHPDYEFVDGPDEQQVFNDVAYCVLADPVVGLPIVPIAMGCEADAIVPGAPTTIVGFGASAGGILNGQPWSEGNGRKRHTTQTIASIDEPYGKAIVVGDGTNSACMGDSGGPVFLQLDDGTWRLFGVATAATLTRVDECGAGAIYQLLHPHVAWIEEDADVDLSPCFATGGTWAPDASCGGFPTAPARTNAAWADACTPTEVGGLAASCGDPFDAGTGDSGSSSSESDDGGVDSTTDATTTESAGETTDAGSSSGESSTSGAPQQGDDGCACATSSRKDASELTALAMLVLGLRWFRSSGASFGDRRHRQRRTSAPSPALRSGCTSGR